MKSIKNYIIINEDLFSNIKKPDIKIGVGDDVSLGMQNQIFIKYIGFGWGSGDYVILEIKEGTKYVKLDARLLSLAIKNHKNLRIEFINDNNCTIEIFNLDQFPFKTDWHSTNGNIIISDNTNIKTDQKLLCENFHFDLGPNGSFKKYAIYCRNELYLIVNTEKQLRDLFKDCSISTGDLKIEINSKKIAQNIKDFYKDPKSSYGDKIFYTDHFRYINYEKFEIYLDDTTTLFISNKKEDLEKISKSRKAGSPKFIYSKQLYMLLCTKPFK